MLARDHALSGALIFTAVAPVLHVTGAGLLAGAVFTASAATLPDIDEPGSTISRTLGFFTEAVSWGVHKISGGHRRGTHSVLGVGLFTFAAWVAVAGAATLTGKVVLGLALGVLLAAGVRALRIGGHHADAIGLAAAAAAVYWHAGLSLVPLCIALGAAAHIAGDELTHDGCPLAWPVSGHEFHLLPRPPADHHRQIRRALDHLHAAARRRSAGCCGGTRGWARSCITCMSCGRPRRDRRQPRIVPVLRPLPQPDLPRGAYWSPKNRRTRADFRAATRRKGSENTTWEMLPYRS